MKEENREDQNNSSPWDPVTKEHWIETWIWNIGTVFMLSMLAVAIIFPIVIMLLIFFKSN